MRTCKNNHKYEAEFFPDGKVKPCIECGRQRVKKWHEAHKNTQEFLIKHKENQRKYYKIKGNSPEARLAQRANRLQTRYWPKLTAWQALAEYESLLAKQNYCCAICEVHQDDYDINFHVDHCHETGQVRGLLCALCNKYIVGGIDIRSKAKKVQINKVTFISNITSYFAKNDPIYIKYTKKTETNTFDSGKTIGFDTNG